ncbi:hypothetical protein TTHERM_000659131 (macronuclear) [Tetrahymena thermophila SB210]|uniref:Uncharacterized protein n=1 Tax=Tetrahymena thermophila (strain SB210) TaxID=312017 RepID=W7WYR3_TETTS|nr:hypothetical protein TTHERM_000659131 [Tetrahymena thermophila SB210]EWS72035.1 hypothetical protein TTHERM_000659131 [Tetrahymena thermophila SB210]6Z1P_AQ Chain AQ, mL102 [Tetrahymena thermophila SB210]|eukprot:XP_012655442.1 hypothetical protein TTHERM_000659131 [Tetrahymena thermophila SB210]
MNALIFRNTNFLFNWISQSSSMLGLLGIRKNMSFQLQEETAEDKTQKKLNELLQGAFDFTNRNARPPKKANHGARPCSSVMRRLKKKYFYRRTKEAMTPEMEPKKKFEL